ncbi:MAG: hypothetical protein NVV74_00560 [Magnetospirillum sp.]|nr:hypothetical protein [Magnetospirillum sp.]
MDEPTGARVIEVDSATAPWGKTLTVQALAFDSGMAMARLRIREGRRFTMLDLDAATAAWLSEALAQALRLAGSGGHDTTAG